MSLNVSKEDISYRSTTGTFCGTPEYIAPEVLEPLAQGLLQDDDVREVQDHPFYNTIHWKLLAEKKLTPPFKPQITSDTDTRYFDPEFTEESVRLTPPDQVQHLNGIDEKDESQMFRQFSYQDISSTLDSSLASSLNSLGVAEEG
ncbi:hypothetical protein Pcinc_024773 [Petrolisthes cinctipes]|uniref:AGC-kinase C-terminal domain-containing protein n=1 Tax=Petrolisthes cinctipes TaxID=88211 RepID=A0AAE1EP36_PETCI|nr:hypothetical protein Pcinc_035018 [Petrolisthes cinctipes]KAK3869940.1 hypothetical protein Pcinc_024773 [Petrolisthes cinctipes]